MKCPICFIILALLLVGCSASTSEEVSQVAITESLTTQSTSTQLPIPTDTSTQKPTSTKIRTPTTTITPTITLTPSITSTPTGDLTFYHVSDCIPKNTSVQKGTVVQVFDGDTISIRLEDGNTYSVRYIGIDAPEAERPYYAETTRANTDMVLNKGVILIKDVSETDQYDRLLRYVIVQNEFVNLELVRLGFAIAETYPPDLACSNTFSSAQNEARAAQIGMWVATQTPEPSVAKVIILAVNKKDEWVEIKNVGTIDVDLAGWNLVSERGNQDCPLSGTIKAGEILRIWSMNSQGGGYYCGYNSPIWNNSEPDPAVLYNAQGVEVSRK